jgi:hypothetical protein
MDQLLSRSTVHGMRTDQSSGVGEKSRATSNFIEGAVNQLT